MLPAVMTNKASMRESARAQETERKSTHGAESQSQVLQTDAQSRNSDQLAAKYSS